MKDCRRQRDEDRVERKADQRRAVVDAARDVDGAVPLLHVGVRPRIDGVRKIRALRSEEFARSAKDGVHGVAKAKEKKRKNALNQTKSRKNDQTHFSFLFFLKYQFSFLFFFFFFRTPKKNNFFRLWKERKKEGKITFNILVQLKSIFLVRF